MQEIVELTYEKLLKLNLINDDLSLSKKLISFSVESVLDFLSMEINPSLNPLDFLNLVSDIALGEYLIRIKNANLDLLNVNFDDAIKTIKEGDVSLTYAIGEGMKTNEQRLDFLIDFFISKKKLLLTKKIIKW